MRVAVDARDLQRRPLRGVGRALAAVLPGLAAGGVELDLLLDDRLPLPADGLPGAPHALHAPVARRAAWLQLAVPAWLAASRVPFHTPFYGLPYRQPVPMVVTIHDLAFEHHPAWFPRGRRTVYRAQARHAARTARRVVTVSEHVADDLVSRYGLPRSRVVVARNGVDPGRLAPRDPDADAWRRAAIGVPASYLLALGGTPRRNAPAAVAAWRRLRDRGRDVALVLLNEPGPPAPGLHRLQYPDDGTFAALLAGATALLYPTRYEGFGLPALEAAALGTPVVAARVGALPEVMGDAAAWSHDLSPTALADATGRLLDDPAWTTTLVARGHDRVRSHGGWEAAVEAHLRAYREAFA